MHLQKLRQSLIVRAANENAVSRRNFWWKLNNRSKCVHQTIARLNSLHDYVCYPGQDGGDVFVVVVFGSPTAELGKRLRFWIYAKSPLSCEYNAKIGTRSEEHTSELQSLRHLV